MSRVFIILSILILFVQNIFSADQEIQLETIYLKDVNWLVEDEKLKKFITNQTRITNLDSLKILEVNSSNKVEKLDNIFLDFNSLPRENSGFLRIVNFQINFYKEPNHGTNDFEINIKPQLNDSKIYFNIDEKEFNELKHPKNSKLWDHLYFDKIKVSSIAEEEFVPASETNKKYALTQDISTNNIVVVNANEEHLKTLECLNPDFKIFNVEEVIDIEINQINVILKEDTKVYFKDRYFGSITNKVENSKISIKIDKSFCPTNKSVCLHDSISFSKWDDIESELNEYKTKSEKRKNWKEYKDYFEENNNNYFKENINNYFIDNKLAPKIKIINTTNNKISIGSVKLGTNKFADVDSFNDKIDEFSLNNQSTTKNQLILEYKVDNKCEKCIPNSIKTQYDIYSKDDDIEISLDEIDTSNLSNPKVEITNLPKDVKVSFNKQEIDPSEQKIDPNNPIFVVTNHTDKITLNFKKDGYKPQIIVRKFNELLHLNQKKDVDCDAILTEWERKPWPKITIKNIGLAKAEVSVKIGKEEQKRIFIDPEVDYPIIINEDLDHQNEIQVLIQCQGKNQSQTVSREGIDILFTVEGKSLVDILVNTLGEDEIKDLLNYLEHLATLFRKHENGVKKTKGNVRSRIGTKLNELKETHSISKEDLKELLNQPMKNGELMTEENRNVILEIWDEVQSQPKKKE